MIKPRGTDIDLSMLDKGEYVKSTFADDYGYTLGEYGSQLDTAILQIEPNDASKAATKKLLGSKGVARTQLVNAFINKGVAAPLLNKFTYNISSEWSTASIPGMLSLGFDAGLAGVGNIGSVSSSRRYWKDSGSIRITPEIRVVDWDGVGMPKMVVATLATYCVSSITDDLNINAKTVDNIMDFLLSFIDINELKTIMTDLANDAKSAIKNNPAWKTLISSVEAAWNAQSPEVQGATVTVTEQIEAMGSTVVQLGAVAGNELKSILYEAFTLRYAPPVLSVKWGGIFEHNDMILTDMTATFSQEYTKAGPLYVDISLTLESRTIIKDIHSTGLALGPKARISTGKSADINK